MVETQQSTEHKESFFEKIFDHHDHHKHRNEGQTDKDKRLSGEGGLRSDLKKDEDGFKQYLKDDKRLEEEGQTYRGLM
ncbi:uncharacterized protein N7515_007137 [Penicillium bovifimosum]|uniref:Uncharacterized protein n=1 Tax=Penicillium bovifimosum TaxID=126998 RepID=A0A9W9GW94_9EURO|nr:uncharacterized protein N7515_007137 [Penicillium bovifimosum]KAJ5131098.1 hypothetical protein N7515_007137 [Penicillium bovifimosum]